MNFIDTLLECIKHKKQVKNGRCKLWSSSDYDEGKLVSFKITMEYSKASKYIKDLPAELKVIENEEFKLRSHRFSMEKDVFHVLIFNNNVFSNVDRLKKELTEIFKYREL